MGRMIDAMDRFTSADVDNSSMFVINIFIEGGIALPDAHLYVITSFAQRNFRTREFDHPGTGLKI